MRKKIVELVKKLIATEMNSYQVHMHFNICLTQCVFFGCSVIEITK